MLAQIALTPILGYPAIMYGGLVTFLLFLTVAVIGWRISIGKSKLPNPLRWHKLLALIALLLGLTHGILGMAIAIGF